MKFNLFSWSSKKGFLDPHGCIANLKAVMQSERIEQVKKNPKLYRKSDLRLVNLIKKWENIT